MAGWLDKLERKFGRYAIRNLMTYIVALNALTLLLMRVDPSGNFLRKIALDPQLVLKGQVWRIVTYIFIPPDTSFLGIFALYFYYLAGSALENEWGSFKFNVYYFTGMLLTTISSFITGQVATPTYLNTSLFLAFARIYPDFRLLLFFILPVKVKYLAWLNWGYLAFTVLNWNIPFEYKIFAVVSIVNYMIFFGKDIVISLKTRRKAYLQGQRFRSQIPKKTTIHKCCICGITEKDDPKMEFRYCLDCKGNYEYCMEHLHTHEHIKE